MKDEGSKQTATSLPPAAFVLHPLLTRRLIAVLWTFGIVALLVANGAGFFFRQPYYETWDMAVNSLAVERAKHFSEWYGPYSRWGFHHPGPAFFYVLALGEWLFYDVLHAVPAPYNAQVLAQVCVSTAFYGAALAVFARRLTPRAGACFFWPVAIAAGALHFGFAAGLPSYDFLRGPSAFTSTWSAHEIVMPFLCLLAAGASVAAGDGQDLPLLAVAAGTLLHAHVAQPLFVGPLASLAYAGLVIHCARRENAAVDTGSGWWRQAGAAWRAFRGRHVVAGLIVAVFALPLAADLFRGADSNLAAIAHHLRTHHGEHKSLFKSLMYFLQFGAYTPYAPGRLDFGHVDFAGAMGYLRGHVLIYAFWAVLLVTVLGITLRPLSATATRPLPAGRGRFLAWSGGFLFAGIALTLLWGTIQDGEMFYYNSWFNFSLYYFGLLMVITEDAGRLDLHAQRSVRWRQRLERAWPAVTAAILCVLAADGLRVRDAIPQTTALLHASVQRVLAATAPGVTALEFPEAAWPVAAAVGLEMARAGRVFEVDDRWVNEFGRDHAEIDDGAAVPWRFKTGPGAVPWRGDAPEILLPETRRLREQLAASPATGPDFPMLDDAVLSTALPVVSWRDGGAGVIDFQRGGNAPDFLLSGWSGAEAWGTWSNGHRSVLRFAAGERATGDGVEVTVEGHPFAAPSAGLVSQRVSVRFNGALLGPAQRLAEGAPPSAWTIPAAAWNATVGNGRGAALEFDLPDAASPAALDRTGHVDDTRVLGLGVSRVRFRAVPVASSH